MNRTLTGVSVLCMALLAAPTAAQAAPSAKAVDKLAAKACAAEKKDIGRKAFDKKYGKDGMPGCVRRTRSKVRAAFRQAEQSCEEELAELGPAEFAEEWGTDETGSDAMANCIADSAESAVVPPEDDGGEEEEEVEE